MAKTPRNLQVRRFEYVGGTSNKFWEIQIHGPYFTTRYGRIGSDGQETTKEYGSPEEALAAYEKIVAEKLGKGYVEIGRAEHMTHPAVPPRAHKAARAPTRAPTKSPSVLEQIGAYEASLTRPRHRVFSEAFAKARETKGGAESFAIAKAAVERAAKPKSSRAIHQEAVEAVASELRAKGAKVTTIKRDAKVVVTRKPFEMKHETPAEIVKKAKYVGVQFKGSISDVANVLWVLQQGRLDAVVILDPPGAKKTAMPKVVRCYGEALAKTLDLPCFSDQGEKLTQHWKAKEARGIVLVLSGYDGPAVQHRDDPSDKWHGVVGVRPLAGKSEAQALKLLDVAGVRPPPQYLVPGLETKGVKGGTFEKALALAAIAAGKFPHEFVLFGKGEKREKM